MSTIDLAEVKPIRIHCKQCGKATERALFESHYLMVEFKCEHCSSITGNRIFTDDIEALAKILCKFDGTGNNPKTELLT